MAIANMQLLAVREKTGLLYFPRYELLSSFEFWSSDYGQKAMHKSPPCISTGVLKKLLLLIFGALSMSETKIPQALL